MLKFILIVLGVITGMGGFIVFSFLSNVKIQAARVEVRRAAARQKIQNVARLKKNASGINVLPSLEEHSSDMDLSDRDVADSEAEGGTETEEGYGKSLRDLEKSLKEEDIPVGNPIDMTVLKGIDDYEYEPLVEDLKLGSKAFIEKFIERLGAIQKIRDKGNQSRILKIMDLELFMLKREKFIHKDVADWARGEIKTVRTNLDRQPTSK